MDPGQAQCTTSVGSSTGQLPKQRYDKLKVAGVLFLDRWRLLSFLSFLWKHKHMYIYTSKDVRANVFTSKQAQAIIIIQVQLVDLFLGSDFISESLNVLKSPEFPYWSYQIMIFLILTESSNGHRLHIWFHFCVYILNLLHISEHAAPVSGQVQCEVPVRTKPNRLEPRRPTLADITKAWNKLPTNV